MHSDFVSELCHMPPETTVKHRRLRGHVDAYRCCVKWLIGSALVGLDVRQHARAESISKRAPSTTRTSLRFRINDLRAVQNSVAQNPPSNRTVQRSDLHSGVCGRAQIDRRRNCVRPRNVLRSLTAIWLSQYRRQGTSMILSRSIPAHCDCSDPLVSPTGTVSRPRLGYVASLHDASYSSEIEQLQKDAHVIRQNPV